MRMLLRSDGGEEGELERLRKGKYIPARRLVHLGLIITYT